MHRSMVAIEAVKAPSVHIPRFSRRTTEHPKRERETPSLASLLPTCFAPKNTSPIRPRSHFGDDRSFQVEFKNRRSSISAGWESSQVPTCWDDSRSSEIIWCRCSLTKFSPACCILKTELWLSKSDYYEPVVSTPWRRNIVKINEKRKKKGALADSRP